MTKGDVSDLCVGIGVRIRPHPLLLYQKIEIGELSC
jgi:hypothetical protein